MTLFVDALTAKQRRDRRSVSSLLPQEVLLTTWLPNARESCLRSALNGKLIFAWFVHGARCVKMSHLNDLRHATTKLELHTHVSAACTEVRVQVDVENRSRQKSGTRVW